jgi:hypothetical protein
VADTVERDQLQSFELWISAAVRPCRFTAGFSGVSPGMRLAADKAPSSSRTFDLMCVARGAAEVALLATQVSVSVQEFLWDP